MKMCIYTAQTPDDRNWIYRRLRFHLLAWICNEQERETMTLRILHGLELNVQQEMERKSFDTEHIETHEVIN